MLSSVLVAAMQLAGQDANALLTGANERMQKAIANARKTGDHQALRRELTASESEFRSAVQPLTAAGDNANAALALIRSGDCLRIMERWSEARERYRELVQFAEKTNQPDYQARGWLVIELVERGVMDYSAAWSAMDTALRIPNVPEATRLKVLDERARLEMAAEDLSQAVNTLSEVVSGARKLGDRELLQASLLSLGGIRRGLATKLYLVYVSMPARTNLEWEPCAHVAAQIGGYLKQARANMHGRRANHPR